MKKMKSTKRSRRKPQRISPTSNLLEEHDAMFAENQRLWGRLKARPITECERCWEALQELVEGMRARIEENRERLDDCSHGLAFMTSLLDRFELLLKRRAPKPKS